MVVDLVEGCWDDVGEEGFTWWCDGSKVVMNGGYRRRFMMRVCCVGSILVSMKVMWLRGGRVEVVRCGGWLRSTAVVFGKKRKMRVKGVCRRGLMVVLGRGR